MVASAGRSGRVPTLAKYDVLEELGHGGMATVYRAHDKRLARDVAVKVLHPHLRESREIAHRFSAEAKAVAKLRHVNIVEVFDVSSEEDDEQFLVVELIRGQTLRKMLQKHGAMPPEIAAAIGVEVLAALAHAHAAGVVHRDVKPENVLVEHRGNGETPIPLPATSLSPVPSSNPPTSMSRKTPDSNRGERVAVKLTDFGIAKLLDAQGVTSTGQVLGSPAHMAPEQIEGGDVDGRADVFGMGVLLYECMVGHLPFEGNNPAQVLRRVLDGIYPSAERERPIVGRVWSQILDRALARKAENRFDDASSMRDAILAELERLGIASPRLELEAWFDDPDGWSAEHEKRLIGRLCELGGGARKRGEAVKAAADYNRALAYAPNDPQLLRIVASMHRAEARIRLLKRVGPLVLGAIVLSTGAYAIASAFKDKPAADRPNSGEPSARASSTPSASPSVSVAVVSSQSVPSASPSNVVASRPLIVTPPTSATAKATKRNVTIGTLSPPFGVHMTIDGAPGPEPGPGVSFAVDDKAHTLVFTCEKDMCEPQTKKVEPGTEDQPISVQMKILPAKLLVEGDPTHSYGIEELPGYTLGSGVTSDINMNGGTRTVTIYDRTDATKKQRVTLKAGQQESVTFR
jgi:eukaryotic-like serine/threonine-protein kinase